MTRRFVVLIDASGAEVERAVTRVLKQFGSWWHWIPNSWLVVSENKAVTTKEVRDALRKDLEELNVTARILVLEVQKRSWAGVRTESLEPQDMFEWIRKTWAKTDPEDIRAGLLRFVPSSEREE